jgi:hypothetical protein
MVYKLILKDGEHVGSYSDKKSPALVAKAMMRVIHQKTGKLASDIRFINNKTKQEYTYKGRLIELDEPRIININGKKFEQMYNIHVERV